MCSEQIGAVCLMVGSSSVLLANRRCMFDGR